MESRRLCGVSAMDTSEEPLKTKIIMKIRKNKVCFVEFKFQRNVLSASASVVIAFRER